VLLRAETCLQQSGFRRVPEQNEDELLSSENIMLLLFEKKW
jgi:hypothetical protein